MYEYGYKHRLAIVAIARRLRALANARTGSLRDGQDRSRDRHRHAAAIKLGRSVFGQVLDTLVSAICLSSLFHPGRDPGSL